jgi:D-alanine-D-alanine ligase-like ATP-grasp enzyme
MPLAVVVALLPLARMAAARRAARAAQVRLRQSPAFRLLTAAGVAGMASAQRERAAQVVAVPDQLPVLVFPGPLISAAGVAPVAQVVARVVPVS